MAVRDRHSPKAPAGKYDPRAGDIEEVERMIRWHERKRADDLEFLDRFHPSAEFPPNDVTNSIADHDRELKKLRAKYSRLHPIKGNPVTKKSNLDFHTRLIHELTALDRRQSTKRGYNPNALGIYFRAAENVTDADSFANAFTPTRGMHTVAKKLGLPLGVERGEWIILRESNPVTKKKTKRKATPAQLRALKKAHAALKRKRALKKKAPKRARRNPAYGNYSKARSVARGNTRGVNPVRKLRAYYVIRQGEGRAKGQYFTGDGFSKNAAAAALFKSEGSAKRIAQKLADRVGASMSIAPIR